MHATPRRLPRATALLLATALTVLLVTPSCGSSDSRSDPPSPTPQVETTIAPPDTTIPSTPSSELRALVDRYWSVWLSANNPPNPDDPGLREVLVGSALDAAVAKIRERADAHQLVALAPNGRFKHALQLGIPNSDPDMFSAMECVIDDTQLIDQASGSVINGDTATYEIIVSFQRDPEGHWRIAGRSRQSRIEGIGGCAEDL